MILNIANTEERFELTSKVLGLINNTHLINELCKEVRNSKMINANILYEVIEAVYTNTPFTDEQLLSCYSVIDELNVFHNIITKFTDIATTLPLEVDLLLFGISPKEQRQLRTEQIFNYENTISDNMYCNPLDKPDLIGRIENVKNCFKKDLSV